MTYKKLETQTLVLAEVWFSIKMANLKNKYFNLFDLFQH